MAGWVDPLPSRVCDMSLAVCRVLDSEVKEKVLPVSWGVQGAVHADMKRMMVRSGGGGDKVALTDTFVFFCGQNSNWRVCEINRQDHCVSPTYPPSIFVPAQASVSAYSYREREERERLREREGGREGERKIRKVD